MAVMRAKKSHRPELPDDFQVVSSSLDLQNIRAFKCLCTKECNAENFLQISQTVLKWQVENVSRPFGSGEEMGKW